MMHSSALFLSSTWFLWFFRGKRCLAYICSKRQPRKGRLRMQEDRFIHEDTQQFSSLHPFVTVIDPKFSHLSYFLLGLWRFLAASEVNHSIVAEVVQTVAMVESSGISGDRSASSGSWLSYFHCCDEICEVFCL